MSATETGNIKSPSETAEPPIIVTPPTTSQNPGSLEDLHRKCRDVFPMCFDGAKVMLQKGLSSHFQVNHTLSLSQQFTGYRLGATYVGNTNEKKEDEPSLVCLADTDISGNTSATVIRQFGERWRLKLQAQTQGNKFATAQGGCEYRGRLSTLGLTAANVDVINDSGIFVGQYLRRVTKKLDLGVEMIYQYGLPIPGGQISAVNYHARYTGKNFIASGAVSSDSLHLCYYQKTKKEDLSFGVEFESNARSGEAVTTIGYQGELPEEGVTMRASVDTNWTVGGVFEKKLSRNLPFTLAVSGMLNHVKAQGKFGIGLIIG